MQIALKYPVAHDGVTYREVTLRRARGRDLLAITKASKEDDIEAGFVAIALLADVPRELVDEMDADDVAALTEAVTAFLPQRAPSEAPPQ
jgi:hypothetical protein